MKERQRLPRRKRNHPEGDAGAGTDRCQFRRASWHYHGIGMFLQGLHRWMLGLLRAGRPGCFPRVRAGGVAVVDAQLTQY